MRFALNSAVIRAAACALALSGAVAGCGRAPTAAPPRSTGSPPDAAALSATVPHGDHNPHHGGVVMMRGELHYEVLLDPTGRAHRVYFSDAVREDLPASIGSDVVLTIKRQSQPEERIVMQIDEAGESWVGNGQPVGTPVTTTARLSFSIEHEPYWIDLPFKSASAPNGDR